MKVLLFLLIAAALIAGLADAFQEGFKQGVAFVSICEKIENWPKYLYNQKQAMEECKK